MAMSNSIGHVAFGAHALIIGIATYPKVSALPEAVLNDARQLAAILTSRQHCGYDLENVQLLLDGQATSQGIRDGLERLASRAAPDDTVIIFFSGHGALLGVAPTSSALVPFDCDPTNIEKTTLSESEFSAALERIVARRLLVLIDACHSGGVGRFKTANTEDPAFGYNEKSLERLAQGAGRVLIASSRASETSLVLAGSSNSLFTEHLIGALSGGARTFGDGMVRVFEVFNYVAERVRSAAPGRQHPIFKASDLEDNYPIALECGGRKSARETTSDVDDWRNLEEALCALYPAGPQDQEIWVRAGGDLSRLRLAGTGRATWFAALRSLRHGGGGHGISRDSLLREALREFPHHPDLARLSSQAGNR